MAGFLNDGFLGGGKGGAGKPGKAGSTPTIGSNGNWFIDGVDTGKKAGGIDLSKFKENEIAVVDSATGELKPSGVFAHDGEVETEPDSVFIGSHEISSSAEGVSFTNLATDSVYAPLWQEVKPGAETGYIRAHGKLESIQRFSAETDQVTNPVFVVATTKNETVFSVDVVLASPVTKLVLEVYLAGKKLYRSRWDSKPSGAVNLKLNTPSDFKINTNYELRFTSEDGDVVFMGDSSGNPKYKVNFVEWRDLIVATQDWVNSLPSSNLSNPVTHVSLIGSDKLQITHADGTKNVLALPSQGGGAVDLTPLKDDITMLEQSLTTQGQDIASLKQKYGNLEHSLGDLRSTYVYTGSSLPDYPDDPQGRYFITLKGQAARDIDVDMPDHNSVDIKDGTMYFLENDNSQATVNLSTPTGQTIGGSKTLSIPSNHHVLLFKKGTDWVIAMNKSNTTSAVQVSASEIAKATNMGEFTGSGSLKSLSYGWWVVKITNTNVTGRPSGSQGDLIVFKQGVSGSSSKPGYGVLLAFGKDSNNKDSIWAEYRDGAQWTPWFKVNDGVGTPVDLSLINRAVGVLQSRTATMANDVSTLKTDVGNIYAPSKTVFDTAVNALIDAKLSAFVPKGGGGGDHHVVQLPRIYAMFSNQVPTTLSVDGTVTSTNGEATLNRIPSIRSRVFVLVENDNDEASKVKGISVDGGMSAAWQPRDITIGGKKYRAFYSAGAYTEKTLKVTVNFG